ncbi:MAG: alpha-L-rhamnosidase N-terminal domain-containing protein [Verrucomicrobia bacterium]|jgi:hypothetical protein|nr:alpha-L-rhamnosidase N-terminal domain-containing protein [Verrucomicrobiota bacterium]
MKQILILTALLLAQAHGAPLTSAEATALRKGGDAHAAWQPRAITLAPAKWIWLPSQRTLPNTFVLFRKEIELSAAPASAFGWIAADSRYLVTVNGQRAQWGPAPCDPRNLDADALDLKPFLKAGTNVIGVEVLFYGHGDGTWPGGKPGLILNLEIEAAGGRQQVVTDRNWQALLDRAHPPGHYKRWFLRALQEEFDARLRPLGWDTASFRPDARWVAAQELNCPADKGSSCGGGGWSADSVDRTAPEISSLRMRQIPPTRETIVAAKGLAHSGRVHWKRDPADWFDVRMPDSFVVDANPVAVARGEGAWELPATPKPDEGVEVTFEFTEQMAGFPRFSIEAPAGTIIEVMAQEGHDPQKTRWLDSHFFSWSRFICREGVNEFEAFDFESFRWLQLHIRNASRPVIVRNLGLRRRQYDWPRTPVLRTSEAPLQRLFDASINTLRNSAIETIVDGMGRERQQYSGDGGHQMHAIRYAFGEPLIVARYLRTFSEGLTKSGFFLDCYPAFDRLARLPQRELDAAYWGPLLDHGVGFDNWNHYLETGDLDAEREPFPRLLRFSDYLWALRDKNGLLPVEDLGIPNVWMDHDAYRKQRDRQCAFNLYTAAMFTHALAPLAEALGDFAHAAEVRQRGAELLRATIARFWSKEERVFLDNLPWLGEDTAPRLSDRALATSVLFDQCPGGDTAAALRALAETPRNMGLSYPCNAGWRYWALAKLGRADVILRDLRMRWATMRSVVQNNALQEAWQAQPDSTSQWSHSPLAPVFVLHQDIVGLRPLAPGFAKMQLRPQLGDLPDLETISHTPRGPVEFKARREGASHHITVKLPQHCAAELVLPANVPSAFPPLTPDGPAGTKRYRLPAGTSQFSMPVTQLQ